MKKLLLAAICLLFLGGNVFASSADITVLINGKNADFPDARPIIRDGRTLVPIRFISSELGYDVAWDSQTQKVTIRGSKLVEININDTRAIVDGNETKLDVAPALIGGRTMVPLRFVSETLGQTVDWIQEQNTILIVGDKGSIANPALSNAEGNSLGNLMSYGKAAGQGNWVYFSNFTDGGRLYKTTMGGTTVKKVSDQDIYISNINVIGDWIYYSAPFDGGRIIKIKNDGTGRTVVLNKKVAQQFYILDGWLYYVHTSVDNFGGPLYRVRLDGSDERLIFDAHVQRFWVQGDWIICSATVNNNQTIWKVKTDGSEQTNLNVNVKTRLLVHNDWIYYIKVENWSQQLFSNNKIKTDGTNHVRINMETRYWDNIAGDWMYYTLGGNDGGPLYKTNLVSGNTVKLTDDNCAWINIVGDWIYYENGYNSRTLFRIKTDGTEKYELVNNAWVKR